MSLKFSKENLILLSGFIWGLSGFTVEILADNSFKALALRFLFILIPFIIIYSNLVFKINKNYLLSLILFSAYILVVLLNAMVFGFEKTYLLREIILFFSFVTILILLNKNVFIKQFINGVYYSLILLVFFYFTRLDFSKIFSPIYRFETNLNPNGVGIITVMLFMISLYKIHLTSKKIHKFFLILINLMSFLVIFAAKSRTVLIIMTLGFIFLNVYFKNKKILLLTTLVLLIVVSMNYNKFSTLIRLRTYETEVKGQKITKLTGRTELWKKGINIIFKNPVLGVGPIKSKVKVDTHIGTYHNAYIQLLVTVGFLGFLPILIMLIVAFKRLVFDKENFLIKVIFITGILSSLVENRLLNYGSPPNLLFFISFIYLSRIKLNRNFEEKKLEI